MKSSALLVDDAVQQNEYLESEKAKKIAKQTVKVKLSGASNMLQSKLQELKGSKIPDEKPAASRLPSAAGQVQVSVITGIAGNNRYCRYKNKSVSPKFKRKDLHYLQVNRKIC